MGSSSKNSTASGVLSFVSLLFVTSSLFFFIGKLTKAVTTRVQMHDGTFQVRIFCSLGGAQPMRQPPLCAGCLPLLSQSLLFHGVIRYVCKTHICWSVLSVHTDPPFFRGGLFQRLVHFWRSLSASPSLLLTTASFSGDKSTHVWN